MLSRKIFEKNLFMVIYFQSVEADKEKNNFLYNLLKDDFNDEEFEQICLDICKTEQLYNKYPTPNMFYSRQKQAQETILVAEGVFYLDDTMPAYKPYLEGLHWSDIERIWDFIYFQKKGQYVSENYVVSQIKRYRSSQGFADVKIPTLAEIKGLIASKSEDNG